MTPAPLDPLRTSLRPWTLVLAALVALGSPEATRGSGTASGAGPAMVPATSPWAPFGQDPEPDALASEVPAPDPQQPDPLRRRARAREVTAAPTPEHLDEALEGALDPDPEVRALWLAVLGRPELLGTGRSERVAWLERAGRRDPDARARRAALEALGRLDDPLACAALLRLARELPPPDRARAAAALPETPRGAPALTELVLAGFRVADVGRRTPPDVLAAALPRHGRVLADREGLPGIAERAPLVLGLRHPHPDVRRAAAEAFDGMMARLTELDDAPRALALLGALEEEGLDPRVVHYHRARLAFYPGRDPELALDSARRLAGTRPALAAEDARAPGEAHLWLFRAHHLTAVAHLAAGRPEAAREPLAAAAGALDALLGRRLDLEGEVLRRRHLEFLHQRAVVQVTELVLRLALGEAPDGEGVIGCALEAHRLSLEAQSHHAALEGDALTGWDAVLDHELSPYRLLFTGLAQPGLEHARSLELQAGVGRALASVAPLEAPGLQPWPGVPPEVADPLEDPRRRALLLEARDGRLDGLTRAVDELRDRARDAAPPFVVPEEELVTLNRLDLQRRILLNELEQPFDEAALKDLRVPGSMALWLARDLRNEGRGAESRTYAQGYADALTDGGLSDAWFYLGQERIAQAELAVGSAWTDDDEPLRAEEALLRARTRLEDLLRRLEENGATERTLEPYRNQLAGALVALAVNANVKLGDPDAAMAYYEAAYAIRQDDFMRVLLACYRARSGRRSEARELLRGIRPGPGTYYNLACAHALLGESARALDFLALDLEESQPSEAARARQRAWAREDPDLAALRGDPRFEELTRPR